MKRSAKRIAALCLMLAALLAAAPIPARAAGSTSLAVTGYKLTNSSGSTLGSLARGGEAVITVSLKDPSRTTDQVASADDVDVSRLVDSFTGGAAPEVTITSQGKAALTFDVKLSGLRYTGSGKLLKLLIGYKGQPQDYETVEMTVSEAAEYEAPKPEETPGTPDTAPVPMVIVSRSDIARPIEAGQELELTVYFRNLSNTVLRSPVVTFTPSDALSVSGGASSFPLADIAGGKTGSLTLKIRAASAVASPNQSLGVELRFNYFNNVSSVQGTASDRISIPALGRDGTPQPVVLVTRSPIDHPVSAGETLDVTLTFRNAGKTRLVSPVAYITTSDALVLLNDVSTFLLGDLEAGGSTDIRLRVRAAREISSPNQSINTELKYSYDNGGVLTQASVSDRVNLSANTTGGTRPDAPVPNVIVSSYGYGGAPVAAGSSFSLSFAFTNTGRLRIENIVVTVDGGESFTMDGSTNTFYYAALDPGASQSQEVPLQALPAAKTGAQSIGLTFKYEYVDTAKRAAATAEIRLSVPVFQKDRFQLTAPVLPAEISAGSEVALTLAYVNKGKSEISNVEASVEGEGVETPARTQYLGNIAAGASGNIGFALTPSQAGEIKLTLRITYEDANQKLQTREFPVTLSAAEPAPVETPPESAEKTGTSGRTWIWIALAAVLAAGGAAAALLRRRKKKTAPASDSSAADWDDWEVPGDGAPSGPPAGNREV